jgi:hypothetical protein
MASRTELQTGNVLRLTTRTQRAMHDKPTPARGHIEGSVKVGQIWIRECGVAEKHRRQGTEHGPLRVGTIQKRRHDVQVKRQVRPCGATHPETTLITTETVNIRNRNTHRSHDNTSRNSVKSQLNGSCVPPPRTSACAASTASKTRRGSRTQTTAIDYGPSAPDGRAYGGSPSVKRGGMRASASNKRPRELQRTQTQALATVPP